MQHDRIYWDNMEYTHRNGSKWAMVAHFVPNKQNHGKHATTAKYRTTNGCYMTGFYFNLFKIKNIAGFI